MNTTAFTAAGAPDPAGVEDLKSKAFYLIMQLPPQERELILRDYRAGVALGQTS